MRRIPRSYTIKILRCEIVRNILVVHKEGPGLPLNTNVITPPYLVKMEGERVLCALCAGSYPVEALFENKGLTLSSHTM